MTPPVSTISTPSTPSPVAWQRWFWPIAIVILTFDQASKWWLFRQPVEVLLPNWVQLHYNPGIAWSAFDKYPLGVALMTLVLIPVLVFTWWRWYRPLGRAENLAFGSILGGALGNAIDRLVLTPLHFSQGVRDFIHVDLGFWPLNPWPTFNIADAGISLGFIILVLSGLRQRPSLASRSSAGPV